MDYSETEAGFPEVEYLGRIKSQYESLSKSQKRIAKYILEHREQVVHYSITTMAQKTNTVPSTITRFCQALSYKGFAELKVYLEKNLASPLTEGSLIQKDDPIEIVLQKLIGTGQNVMADTLRTLDGGEVIRVVDKMLAAKNIVFFGQSGGYISGRFGQQQLRRMNLMSHAVTGSLEMGLVASTLGENDVAIGIAYSGEVSAVVDALKTAKYNNATIVVITAMPNSTMAKLANHRLCYSNNIPDALQYLHVASICEIAILGAIEAEIFRRPMQQEKIESCKQAVLASREK